jgi:hypothetical protein
VQCPQNMAAACHGPAEQYPGAPKQVQEQDAFGENRFPTNSTVTPRCWRSGMNYPLIRSQEDILVLLWRASVSELTVFACP